MSMTWFALAGSWAAIVVAIITIGSHDDWLDPDVKSRFGEWLPERLTRSHIQWLRSANRTFLQLFDRFYGGKGTNLEEFVWSGLLVSVLVFVAGRVLFTALNAPWPYNGDALLIALALAFGIYLTRIGIFSYVDMVRAFQESQPGKRRSADILASKTILGLVAGTAGVVLVTTLVALYARMFKEEPLSLIGLILTCAFLFPIAMALSFLPIRKIRVNPLKAIASSLFFVVVLGLIKLDALNSFSQALQNYGIGVLGFVAFNVFADAVSLLETRWILQRGASSSLLVCIALLILDLILSGAIYLFLPAILGEIAVFWDAVVFRGPQAWMGILFWTTFSTSLLFYLFVAAALLSRPLAAVAATLRFFTSPFNLAEYPIRSLSAAMVVVVTIVFLLLAIVTVIM